MIPSAYYNLKEIDPASAGLLDIYLDKTAAVNFSGLMKNVGQRFNNMAGKANTFMQGAKQVGKGALQGAGYGGLGGAVIGGGLGFLDPGTQNGETPGIMDRIRGGINGAVTGTGIGMGIGAGVGGYRSFGKGNKMPGLNTVAQNKSLPKTNNVPQLTYNQPNTVAAGGNNVINASYSKVGSLTKEAANPGFSSFFNNAGKILRRSGQGALAGGIGGAALGFMDPETSTNPMTGQKTDPGIGGRIRSAIQGAGTGAALGGIGGAAYGFAGKGGKAVKGKKQNVQNTQQAVNQNAQQAAANAQAAQGAVNQTTQQASAQRNRQTSQNTRRQNNRQQQAQQQVQQQAQQQAAANAQAAQTQVPAQSQQVQSPSYTSNGVLESIQANQVNPDNLQQFQQMQQLSNKLVNNRSNFSIRDQIQLQGLLNQFGAGNTVPVSTNNYVNRLSTAFNNPNGNPNDGLTGALGSMNFPGLSGWAAKNLPTFMPGNRRNVAFLNQNANHQDIDALTNYFFKKSSYNPFLKYAAHNFDVYDMGGKILADDVRTFIERQLPMYKNTTMDLLNKIKSLISGEVSYFKNKQLPDLKKFTNMLGEATGLKQPRNIQKPDVVKQLKTLASKPHSQPSTIKADVENVIEMVADKTGSYKSIEQQMDSLVKTSSFWDNL